MINLLEGVPGSGKSYEAVVYHVLPALKMGRKVITNLPLRMDAFAAIDPGFMDLIELRKAPQPIFGRWDAEAANRGEQAFIVGDFGDAEASADCVIRSKRAIPAPTNARLFGGVWDFYDEWRGEGNIGPLFVIDECHVSFPRENLRKGRFTADEVIQWFKISRHFGADVLLITQRMRALDEDVAGLAEMHIRVRKATFLGRPDQYIRKVFAGLRGGEVQSDERPYKPQYFGLYQSHTQGAAVIEASASDVAPANLKWKRMSWSMFGIAGVGVLFLAFKLSADKPLPSKVKTPPGKESMRRMTAPGQASASSAANPAIEAGAVKPLQIAARSAEPAAPEPMQSRGLHLAGCGTMNGKMTCIVAVSQNGQPVFTVTHHDLEVMGYQFARKTDCAAVVTWKGSARSVICDLPQIAQGIAGTGAMAYQTKAVTVRDSIPQDVASTGGFVVSPSELTQPRSQWAEELAARNSGVKSSLK